VNNKGAEAASWGMPRESFCVPSGFVGADCHASGSPVIAKSSPNSEGCRQEACARYKGLNIERTMGRARVPGGGGEGLCAGSTAQPADNAKKRSGVSHLSPAHEQLRIRLLAEVAVAADHIRQTEGVSSQP
jgi:hypothetical protein